MLVIFQLVCCDWFVIVRNHLYKGIVAWTICERSNNKISFPINFSLPLSMCLCIFSHPWIYECECSNKLVFRVVFVLGVRRFHTRRWHLPLEMSQLLYMFLVARIMIGGVSKWEQLLFSRCYRNCQRCSRTWSESHRGTKGNLSRSKQEGWQGIVHHSLEFICKYFKENYGR